MRRIVLLFLALVLCLSLLAVPALAAENQEYIFELVPPFSLYGDFVFAGDGQMALYEGYVPEGSYYLYLSVPESSDWELFFDSPISVDYSLTNDTLLEEPFTYSCSLVYPDEIYSPEIWITDTYGSHGFSAFLIFSFKGAENLTGGFIKLVPVNSSSRLCDIVSSDMLSGSIDEIVQLLPIVLVVIVAFIGIRKGISFLLQFLRSA